MICDNEGCYDSRVSTIPTAVLASVITPSSVPAVSPLRGATNRRSLRQLLRGNHRPQSGAVQRAQGMMLAISYAKRCQMASMSFERRYRMMN
jgi:hypothetical protein